MSVKLTIGGYGLIKDPILGNEIVGPFFINDKGEFQHSHPFRCARTAHVWREDGSWGRDANQRSGYDIVVAYDYDPRFLKPIKSKKSKKHEIDWEARRWEAAMHFGAVIVVGFDKEPNAAALQAVGYADELIKHYKATSE